MADRAQNKTVVNISTEWTNSPVCSNPDKHANLLTKTTYKQRDRCNLTNKLNHKYIVPLKKQALNKGI